MAAAVGAAGCSGVRGAAGVWGQGGQRSHHDFHNALQRPTPRDDRLSGGGLREGHRHQGQRPQRRRRRPGQPDRGRGKKSPADVIYTENSQALQFLHSKGLLAAIPSSTLAKVRSRYNSPSGNWVGVSARVSVIVYNTKLLSSKQLPTSVMDLANPKWSGKPGLAPSETDFQPIITSVVHSHGQAQALRWLEGMKKNAASHTYPDNETLVAAVNSGQVAVGIINHYYWYRLRYEMGNSRIHSSIAYFAPHDPGYV